MTKRQRLEAEKKKAQRQVDLFEKKYKNFDTIHHQHLKRINKELAKLKPKTKKKPVKKAELEKGVTDG